MKKREQKIIMISQNANYEINDEKCDIIVMHDVVGYVYVSAPWDITVKGNITGNVTLISLYGNIIIEGSTQQNYLPQEFINMGYKPFFPTLIAPLGQVLIKSSPQMCAPIVHDVSGIRNRYAGVENITPTAPEYNLQFPQVDNRQCRQTMLRYMDTKSLPQLANIIHHNNHSPQTELGQRKSPSIPTIPDVLNQIKHELSTPPLCTTNMSYMQPPRRTSRINTSNLLDYRYNNAYITGDKSVVR
jgi:hypothetical protein